MHLARTGTTLKCILLSIVLFSCCQENITELENRKMPYDAVTKRFISASLYEVAITLPNNILIPNTGALVWSVPNPLRSEFGGSYIGATYFREDLNPLSNFQIRSMGIFCNLGEYLKFVRPYVPIQIQYEQCRYGEGISSGGTVSGNANSKQITGAGTTFTADFTNNNGDVIFDSTGKYIGVVHTVANDTLLTLTNYPMYIPSADNYIPLYRQSIEVRATEVFELNKMYPCVDYVNPADLAGDGDYVFLFTNISYPDDLELYTIDVPAGYDGELIHFHSQVELTY